jgi:hypothetical protein
MKERLKSPVVWAGIIATIITVSGIDPSNMTEWGILGQNLLNIVKNPFLLISVSVAVFGFLNNPSDKKRF